MIPIVIILLLVHLIFIVLEIFYDTLVHKYKSSTDNNLRKRYSRQYHTLQLIIYFIIFLYGYYISKEYNLISWTMLAIIANYTATRIWLFNPIYNSINGLSKTYLSTTELYDTSINKFMKWVLKRTSIKNIGILTMVFNIIKFILYFGSVIYLHINL